MTADDQASYAVFLGRCWRKDTGLIDLARQHVLDETDAKNPVVVRHGFLAPLSALMNVRFAMYSLDTSAKGARHARAHQLEMEILRMGSEVSQCDDEMQRLQPGDGAGEIMRNLCSMHLVMPQSIPIPVHPAEAAVSCALIAAVCRAFMFRAQASDFDADFDLDGRIVNLWPWPPAETGIEFNNLDPMTTPGFVVLAANADKGSALVKENYGL